jgi:hypothetical protein
MRVCSASPNVKQSKIIFTSPFQTPPPDRTQKHRPNSRHPSRDLPVPVLSHQPQQEQDTSPRPCLTVGPAIGRLGHLASISLTLQAEHDNYSKEKANYPLALTKGRRDAQRYLKSYEGIKVISSFVKYELFSRP